MDHHHQSLFHRLWKKFGERELVNFEKTGKQSKSVTTLWEPNNTSTLTIP